MNMAIKLHDVQFLYIHQIQLYDKCYIYKIWRYWTDDKIWHGRFSERQNYNLNILLVTLYNDHDNSYGTQIRQGVGHNYEIQTFLRIGNRHVHFKLHLRAIS